jgi:hypothetical protein
VIAAWSIEDLPCNCRRRPAAETTGGLQPRSPRSLDPVADAIQNFDLRIALGIALCFLFFTLIV